MPWFAAQSAGLKSLYWQLTSFSPHNFWWWAVAITALFWSLEQLKPWFASKKPLPAGSTPLDNTLLSVLNLLIAPTLLFFAASSLAFNGAGLILEHFSIDLDTHRPLQTLPYPLQWLILFVLRDWIHWTIHRLLHAVPFLWRWHQVHHSAEHMNVLVHLRFHPIESVLYQSLEFLPLAMLGYHSTELFSLHIIALSWGHLNHANLNLPLGPLAYVFNGPSMHRWHHVPPTMLPAERVRVAQGVNFGLTLSCWDHLFGTAYLPNRDAPATMGLQSQDQAELRQPWYRLILHPYPQLIGWLLGSVLILHLVAAAWWLWTPRIASGSPVQSRTSQIGPKSKHPLTFTKQVFINRTAIEQRCGSPRACIALKTTRRTQLPELDATKWRQQARFSWKTCKEPGLRNGAYRGAQACLNAITNAGLPTPKQLEHVPAHQPPSSIVIFGENIAGWGEEGRVWWDLVLAGYRRVYIYNAGGVAQLPPPNPNRQADDTATTERVDSLRVAMLHTPHAIVRAQVLTSHDAGNANTSAKETRENTVSKTPASRQTTPRFLDARSTAEYKGKTPYGARRGGHIPDAISLPWKRLFDAQGHLLNPAEVHKKLSILGLEPDHPLISYCTGGVRSAMLTAVLQHYGYVSASNYDGSWWHYASEKALPVARE